MKHCGQTITEDKYVKRKAKYRTGGFKMLEKGRQTGRERIEGEWNKERKNLSRERKDERKLFSENMRRLR